jgi:5-methylcytosine-specific restriction protein B
MAAPLRELPAEDAWERLRGQFITAFDALASGDVDSVDDLDLLRFGPALVTKSLATYFPDQFLPMYSSTHLREFIGLLGGVPEPGAMTWRLNRQLRRLVFDRPEFDGWPGLHVRRFFYGSFDPRPRQRAIWKIAPGERGRLWEECLTDGVIRVAWDEVEDLDQYESDAELKKALDEHWPESSGRSLTLARYLLQFRDLEPGDVVVANRGMSEVLGIGSVRGGYQYEPDRSEYRHTVPVDWDTSAARTLDEPQRGWRPTFSKVSTYTFAKLTGQEPDVGTATAEEGEVRPSTADVPEEIQSVLDALKRKGQVILYGPPGTGKTYLALSTALALGGRVDAIATRSQERNAAVSALVKTEQVQLVTFHPSYGYEDFVEGYKPSPAATGPGLTLELSDGVFHSLCTAALAAPDRTFLLVIDEINRGDLPRILGELVTCLELDKRGLPVTLPISKRPFTVPSNVRIIGTMNTADRSISHLDAAVRRRFAFLPIGPDPDAIAGAVGPLDLPEFFDELNSRITRHVDADHQLGHAYLMNGGDPLETEEELAAAFSHDILPLLEDYCLGQVELLHSILGGLVDAETGRAALMPPQDLVAALATEFTSAQRVESDG